MQPTRATQPHRKNTGRVPSPALAAMLRGAPAFLPNPMDVNRRTMSTQNFLAGLLASAGRSTLRR
jgi:hypothetical protein